MVVVRCRRGAGKRVVPAGRRRRRSRDPVPATALALGAADETRHPIRSALAIVAALIVGVALLYEYGVAG
jgi:hypothetical protein